MTYEEAKKLSDEAEKKFYESAEPMSPYEMRIIDNFKRHCANHFGELLEAAKEIRDIIDKGILEEGYICDTFTAQPLRSAIDKCEKVASL